jgi:formylglycine-generating enzyme required for sulfatase activity
VGLVVGQAFAEQSPLQAVGGIFPDVRRAVPLSRLEAQALRPLDHFKECDACPEMVVVPPGRFLMGAPEDEPGSTASERPQHPVTIARPFAVGRFTVTFDEWDACVAAGGCRYRPSDQGWGRGSRPVLDLLWDDAKDYVWWLSRVTGRPYRLLSEAEREYVARAGTTTAFWWGSTFAHDKANINRDSSDPDTSSTLLISTQQRGVVPKTTPVHSFAPNAFGLYQVHGNVYDWVEDCWNDSYEGAPSDGSAWTEGHCQGRVLRGGAFSRNPQAARSAARIWSGPPNRLVYMSVRVARTLR